VEKVESCPMIRFVRVTYVRPVADFGVGSAAEYHSAIYSPPSGFNYRTFLPAPVKVGMCSGSPVYETVSSTCERSKIWLRCVGMTLSLRFHATILYHCSCLLIFLLLRQDHLFSAKYQVPELHVCAKVGWQ